MVVQIGITVGGNEKQYIGSSTDSKPTDCGNGSSFYEEDTKKSFIFDGTAWNDKTVYDITPAFTVQATLTRSATVTAYTAGQLILGNGATVLPTLDLSTATGLNLANRKIAITGAFLVSSNGANSAFNGFIDLFNVSNPAGTTYADYVAFTPTAAALASNFVGTLDSMSNTRKYGAVSNLSMQTEILRKCTLDATGKLYFAPAVGSSGYTPASGEVLTLMLKFYLLN